jgi:hypothetical protein
MWQKLKSVFNNITFTVLHCLCRWFYVAWEWFTIAKTCKRLKKRNEVSDYVIRIENIHGLQWLDGCLLMLETRIKVEDV